VDKGSRRFITELHETFPEFKLVDILILFAILKALGVKTGSAETQGERETSRHRCLYNTLILRVLISIPTGAIDLRGKIIEQNGTNVTTISV
jgi:hypothetical protein